MVCTDEQYAEIKKRAGLVPLSRFIRERVLEEIRFRNAEMARELQHRIHDRWVNSGMIPVLTGGDKRKYEHGQQCLHCVHYVPLEHPLGSDWGACTNREASFDGQIVFEHHTCPVHKFRKED